jgi:predicted DNA-binding transcriptional regulator AlpA
MAGPDDLLSTEELAEWLGLSAAAIERWRSAGEGPAYVRLVKVIRYRRGDVQAWLDANRYEHIAAERAAAEQAGREFRQGRPPRAGQD